MTLHMLSVSKLIGPGPRVGILYGPADLLKKVGKIAEDTYISPALLSQGIVYEYLRSGKLPDQIARLKALYAPRLQACLDALDKYLPDAQTTRPDGGFFLSVTLPEGISTVAVRERAKTYQLNLADGQAFFPDGGGERFLRLPYCALSPEEINEGISRLAATVKELRAR
jgi:DNA-binding transcriptional MocR family regulator